MIYQYVIGFGFGIIVGFYLGIKLKDILS